MTTENLMQAGAFGAGMVLWCLFAAVTATRALARIEEGTRRFGLEMEAQMRARAEEFEGHASLVISRRLERKYGDRLMDIEANVADLTLELAERHCPGPQVYDPEMGLLDDGSILQLREANRG